MCPEWWEIVSRYIKPALEQFNLYFLHACFYCSTDGPNKYTPTSWGGTQYASGKLAYRFHKVWICCFVYWICGPYCLTRVWPRNVGANLSLYNSVTNLLNLTLLHGDVGSGSSWSEWWTYEGISGTPHYVSRLHRFMLSCSRNCVRDTTCDLHVLHLTWVIASQFIFKIICLRISNPILL